MDRKFKVSIELGSDGGGAMITGGGKINDVEKVAVVHALGAALGLSKLDWAILAATSNFDTQFEGTHIHIPVPKTDEE